ncbi:hypothetical protein DUNSADRAFT_12782 [Dunaliella salina]|uniref:Encoded protein n=1 Tax=Dunaliella salina TaxID=3046 RepID=A0ABQ7FRN4_DUNSA|nr:hypothetical protein DUNSADRAFT_12782 [Dunaliella salina]|eukprot:KAF5825258.1 hypothetical protein DUNSADRAFT_12782 [Dunaliella salina]
MHYQVVDLDLERSAGARRTSLSLHRPWVHHSDVKYPFTARHVGSIMSSDMTLLVQVALEERATPTHAIPTPAIPTPAIPTPAACDEGGLSLLDPGQPVRGSSTGQGSRRRAAATPPSRLEEVGASLIGRLEVRVLMMQITKAQRLMGAEAAAKQNLCTACAR